MKRSDIVIIDKQCVCLKENPWGSADKDIWKIQKYLQIKEPLEFIVFTSLSLLNTELTLNSMKFNIKKN